MAVFRRVVRPLPEVHATWKFPLLCRSTVEFHRATASRSRYRMNALCMNDGKHGHRRCGQSLGCAAQNGYLGIQSTRMEPTCFRDEPRSTANMRPTCTSHAAKTLHRTTSLDPMRCCSTTPSFYRGADCGTLPAFHPRGTSGPAASPGVALLGAQGLIR